MSSSMKPHDPYPYIWSHAAWVFYFHFPLLLPLLIWFVLTCFFLLLSNVTGLFSWEWRSADSGKTPLSQNWEAHFCPTESKVKPPTRGSGVRFVFSEMFVSEAERCINHPYQRGQRFQEDQSFANLPHLMSPFWDSNIVHNRPDACWQMCEGRSRQPFPVQSQESSLWAWPHKRMGMFRRRYSVWLRLYSVCYIQGPPGRHSSHTSIYPNLF